MNLHIVLSDANLKQSTTIATKEAITLLDQLDVVMQQTVPCSWYTLWWIQI